MAAKPADHVMIARKEKGTVKWYVGAITDENSRDLPLDLPFLEPGKTYEVTLYRDAPTANWATNPEAYVIEKKTITTKTKLSLHLVKGGGCAVQIVRR
ncbi:glycoside hydrolase family 97 C-terminal domain-containing protein [Spirosoma aerophilum]